MGTRERDKVSGQPPRTLSPVAVNLNDHQDCKLISTVGVQVQPGWGCGFKELRSWTNNLREREKGVEKFERSFGGVCPPTLANGWDRKGEGI